MSQIQWNNISILRVHRNEEINLEIVANQFINNSNVR